MELHIIKCGADAAENQLLFEGVLSPPIRCASGTSGRNQMARVTIEDEAAIRANVAPCLGRSIAVGTVGARV